MTQFTLERLASITGISEEELIKRLKEKGVDVESGQSLTKEQVLLVKESLKNRSKVSVKSSSASASKPKSNQTVITRLNTKDKKPKLTLSKTTVAKKPILQPKKVEPPKKEEPVIEEPIEEPMEEMAPLPKKKEITTTIKEITLGDETTLSELARKTLISEVDLSQTFFNNGYMVKKNDPIDFDTATLLLDTLNIKVEKKLSSEEILQTAQHSGSQVSKAPIVTIMGHVDHGKTSLLDYIRSSKVAAKEAGGITQHISAYQVKTNRGLITFLDTPGHEAFSQMRSRGAKVTDIIILIIAANDGLKPQTIESIQHAKSTNTPIIVAITKMDIADTGKVDQILSDLSTHDVLVESWGGDVPLAKISSKTGDGVDELLELVSIQAELMELKAYDQGQVSGHVCEARVDRGRGAVITLIIESGTLQVGDILAIGQGSGKVRTMTDAAQQKRIKQAKPATPVEITGISPLPKAGDLALSHPDEKSARQAADLYQQKNSKGGAKQILTLDSMLTEKAEHELSLILKADTQGSLEAIDAILNDLKIEDTELKIIDSQVGSVNSSDVNLATSANAQIIAFHVNIESTAKKLLEQLNVKAFQFKVIYALIDHVKDSLVKLKGPVFKEVSLGSADVLAVFRSSKFGQIAGCLVTDGLIKRGEKVKVIRKGETIFEGDLASVKREKETLTEARKNTECGLGIKNFSDAKVGDVIECYTLEEDV